MFEEGSCEKKQRDWVVSGWRTCGQGGISLFWMGTLKHPRVFLEWSNGEQDTHDWGRGSNCRTGVLKWVRWNNQECK